MKFKIKILALICVTATYHRAPLAWGEVSAVKAATEANTSVAPNFEKEPTYITSSTLTLFAKDRHFEYSGKVEVKQADMTLTSDFLDGYYDQNNQIQKLVARSNVLITKGDKIKASSQRATYARGDQTLILTENPVLQQGDNLLSADKITVFLKDNRSQAAGNVRAKVVNSADLSSQVKLR